MKKHGKFFDKKFSDAYSGWLDTEDKVSNEEVAEATEFLIQESIPQFAQELYLVKYPSQFPFIHALHRHGVNGKFRIF
jgi:hypothetical protein